MAIGDRYSKQVAAPVGLSAARRTLDASISEAEHQRLVIETAELYGWRTYHTYDARRSAAGFPDLVLVRPPRLLLVELKTEKGRLQPAQREWLDLLGACPGVEVAVWRPGDWAEIEARLRP